MAKFKMRISISNIEAATIGLSINSIDNIAKAFDSKIIFRVKEKGEKVYPIKTSNDSFRQQIANEIRRIRTKRNLSQIELSKMIGFKGSRVISEVELNKKSISISSLLKIIEVLELDLVFGFQR